MDPHHSQAEYLFLPSGTITDLAQFPATVTSSSMAQMSYSTPWPLQSMPIDYYQQHSEIPMHTTLSDEQQRYELTASLSQYFSPEIILLSPQIVSPPPFIVDMFGQHAPLPTDSAVEHHTNVASSHATISEVGESMHSYLFQEQSEQQTSAADEQASWSAADSPVSGTRSPSKSASSPREASAMQKKSSARQCELCDKWVVDMKKHRESHEETRAAKCPLTACAYTAKGMSRVNDIKRHVVAQHWSMGLFCVFCPGGRGEPGLHFEKAQAFRTHMRSVHGVQNRGTRDAAKMPEVLRSDGSHGHCQVCQFEMRNYQHLHDHLETCIRRELVASQGVDETNIRNLATVSSPELTSGPAYVSSTSARPVRHIRRPGKHAGDMALLEAANADSVGVGESMADFSSWHDYTGESVVMRRTTSTYDGSTLIHRDGMLFET